MDVRTDRRLADNWLDERWKYRQIDKLGILSHVCMCMYPTLISRALCFCVPYSIQKQTLTHGTHAYSQYNVYMYIYDAEYCEKNKCSFYRPQILPFPLI